MSMSLAARSFHDRKAEYQTRFPPWNDPRQDVEVDFLGQGFVAPQAIRNPPRYWPYAWPMPRNWFGPL